MGRLTITLAAALIGLAAALCVLWVKHRRLVRLAAQVEEFVTTEKHPLAYSVREDDLAPLHNAVAELENHLLVAREQLVEETRRVSDLTADISHQLRTPLSSLRLFCELDAGPHLEAQLSQLERMERLIESLLRLERLCADGYEFTFADHDLVAIINNAWSTLRNVYPGCELTVTGSAVIRCDEKWLGEAFLNLLKNACAHTRADCRIKITLESTSTTLFCYVEDNGGGVPTESLHRLFERFYRVEGASQEGTGIGLSMVREIIRRHHGDIHAENTMSGLKMCISLPRMRLSMPA